MDNEWAEATINQLEERLAGAQDECERLSNRLHDYEAVIEAARALCAWRFPEPGWPQLLDQLRAAVEALEEVER
jgi:hypothetical protein